MKFKRKSIVIISLLLIFTMICSACTWSNVLSNGDADYYKAVSLYEEGNYQEAIDKGKLAIGKGMKLVGSIIVSSIWQYGISTCYGETL